MSLSWNDIKGGLDKIDDILGGDTGIDDIVGDIQDPRGIIGSITFESAALPPITVEAPLAEGEESAEPNPYLTWLRPRVTIKFRNGKVFGQVVAPVVIKPYGDPPSTPATSWLGPLLAITAVVGGYYIYKGVTCPR